MPQLWRSRVRSHFDVTPLCARHTHRDSGSETTSTRNQVQISTSSGASAICTSERTRNFARHQARHYTCAGAISASLAAHRSTIIRLVACSKLRASIRPESEPSHLTPAATDSASISRSPSPPHAPQPTYGPDLTPQAAHLTLLAPPPHDTTRVQPPRSQDHSPLACLGSPRALTTTALSAPRSPPI